jgi:hypothetical protein
MQANASQQIDTGVSLKEERRERRKKGRRKKGKKKEREMKRT